jgi:hypothetical protein
MYVLQCNSFTCRFKGQRCTPIAYSLPLPPSPTSLTLSLSVFMRHVILCEMAPKWNSHRIQQDAYGAWECQTERYFYWFPHLRATRMIITAVSY